MDELVRFIYCPCPSAVIRSSDHDIGGVGMFHADDVIPGVDMMHFAGHHPRHVGEQVRACLTDIFDGHVAAQRRVLLVPFKDVAEVADAGSGQCLDRPRREGVDADILGAEVGGEVAHARLQRGLGDAHDVVMRYPLLRPVIGEREQRAAVRHHRLGALGDRRERIAADQHRLGEIIRRGVDIAAVELFAVGEGDGVEQEIDAAPGRLQLRERGIDRCRLGDIAIADHDAADLLRQRFHAFSERVALVGESKLGAVRVAGLGDAPGERAAIGHTHDQTALAAHKPRNLGHCADPAYGVHVGTSLAASYGIGLPGPASRAPRGFTAWRNWRNSRLWLVLFDQRRVAARSARGASSTIIVNQRSA